MIDLLDRLKAHGAVFDAAVLIFSILAPSILFAPVFRAAVTVDQTFRPTAALAWMIAAAGIAQMIGSFLKAQGQQRRIYDDPSAFHFSALRWPVLLLLALHLVTFFFLLAIATAAPGADTLVNGLSQGTIEVLRWVMILPTVCVSLCIAFPVSRLLPDNAARFSELAGNVLLIASAVVVQAWVQGIFLPLMGIAARADAEHGGWSERVVQLVVVFFVCAMFYLPPRILFLLEDRGSRFTWIQISLVSFLLGVRYYLFPPGADF